MKWKNIFTVLLPCWHFWVSDPNNTFYKLLASHGRSVGWLVVEWSVGRLAPCGVVVRAVLKHNTIQYINRKPNKTNNSLNNNNNNHNTTSERTIFRELLQHTYKQHEPSDQPHTPHHPSIRVCTDHVVSLFEIRSWWRILLTNVCMVCGMVYWRSMRAKHVHPILYNFSKEQQQ